MKAGKVNSVVAVEIICSDEDCKGLCTNAIGSYMITSDDETVTCENCGSTYKVPARAFGARRVHTKQKIAIV
jgi:hypothetical protein